MKVDEYKVIEAKVTKLQDALFAFLRKNKVQVPDKKMETLIQALQNIQTIIPGTEYVTVDRNSAGYIEGFTIADGVSARVDEVPEDLNRGYYKMDESGRFILDDEKRERYWAEI